MQKTPETPPQKSHFGAGIRTWFLTGLVIAGPLAVTAWLVLWFVRTVDNVVKPIIPPYLWPDTYLPIEVPGVGVIVAFVGLTLLGFFAANLAGRTLLRLGERILDRMPVIRGIYKSVKQIFETVFSQNGTGFRKVGLVQFPMEGMWSIVFLSTAPGPMVKDNIPNATEDFISVFLPCTPNPTTGFYFYVPSKDVIEIPMSPEQAAKLIMSAGLIQPEVQDQLTKLAEDTKAKRAVEKLSAPADM